jgi:hypothetical protein
MPIKSDRKIQKLKRITDRVSAKQLHCEPPRLEEFEVSELIVIRRWIRGHAVFARDAERRRPDRPEVRFVHSRVRSRYGELLNFFLRINSGVVFTGNRKTPALVEGFGHDVAVFQIRARVLPGDLNLWLAVRCGKAQTSGKLIRASDD